MTTTIKLACGRMSGTSIPYEKKEFKHITDSSAASFSMLASSFDGIPLTRQTDDHADRGRGERGGGDCYSTYRRGEG